MSNPHQILGGYAQPTSETPLAERQLANRWGISPRTLAKWRCNGRGPAFLKLGSAVRYPIEDVVRYELERRHSGGGEGPSFSASAPDPQGMTFDRDPFREVPPASLRIVWTGAAGDIAGTHTLPLDLDDDGEPDRRSWTAATVFFQRLEIKARRKAIAEAALSANDDDD